MLSECTTHTYGRAAQAISQRCAAGRNTRMIDFKEMEKVEQLNVDYGAGAQNEMVSS